MDSTVEGIVVVARFEGSGVGAGCKQKPFRLDIEVFGDVCEARVGEKVATSRNGRAPWSRDEREKNARIHLISESVVGDVMVVGEKVMGVGAQPG